MREILTNIQIDASESKVWKILTDFPKYKDWNPFIISASGEIKY